MAVGKRRKLVAQGVRQPVFERAAHRARAAGPFRKLAFEGCRQRALHFALVGLEPMTDFGPRSRRGILHQQADHRCHIVEGLFLFEHLLLQGVALRLQHLGRLETQRQKVARFAQESVHLPHQDGAALFGEVLQGTTGKLGFKRLAEVLKAGLRRIREDPRRPGKVPGKLRAHIVGDFHEFLIVEEVGFGEQYGDFRRVPVKALQQIDVALGKGRIDADRD
ncbi:MAG: hypothetical protein WCB12_22385 [Bryobacteraceae bacterium]